MPFILFETPTTFNGTDDAPVHTLPGLDTFSVQGYLAHKKLPTPPGLPQGPRHSPTVGSKAAAVFYERSILVVLSIYREAGSGHL
jgi:hypothetical protein